MPYIRYAQDAWYEDSGSFGPEVRVTSDGFIHGNRVRPRHKGDDTHEGSDSQEQIERCKSCPMERCKNDTRCWYRLGLEPPGERGRKEYTRTKPAAEKPKEPKPPKGYDEEKLRKAMEHAYFDAEIAEELGISVYMVKKWLAWLYKED